MSTEVDELKERIEKLEQERDELQSEIGDYGNELSNREQEGYDRAILEMESKTDHAFRAGYNDKYLLGQAPSNCLELTKALLNYKMEQRL